MIERVCLHTVCWIDDYFLGIEVTWSAFTIPLAPSSVHHCLVLSESETLFGHEEFQNVS